MFNNFKIRLFGIKGLAKIPTRGPTLELATESTKQKESKLRLQQEFMNEIIVDKNDEVFWNYFIYQNPLAKY